MRWITGWVHCGYRSHKLSGGREEGGGSLFMINPPSTHIWYSSNWNALGHCRPGVFGFRVGFGVWSTTSDCFERSPSFSLWHVQVLPFSLIILGSWYLFICCLCVLCYQIPLDKWRILDTYIGVITPTAWRLNTFCTIQISSKLVWHLFFIFFSYITFCIFAMSVCLFLRKQKRLQ